MNIFLRRKRICLQDPHSFSVLDTLTQKTKRTRVFETQLGVALPVGSHQILNKHYRVTGPSLLMGDLSLINLNGKVVRLQPFVDHGIDSYTTSGEYLYSFRKVSETKDGPSVETLGRIPNNLAEEWETSQSLPPHEKMLKIAKFGDHIATLVEVAPPTSLTQRKILLWKGLDVVKSFPVALPHQQKVCEMHGCPNGLFISTEQKVFEASETGTCEVFKTGGLIRSMDLYFSTLFVSVSSDKNCHQSHSQRRIRTNRFTSS